MHYLNLSNITTKVLGIKIVLVLIPGGIMSVFSWVLFISSFSVIDGVRMGNWDTLGNLQRGSNFTTLSMPDP